MPESPQNLALSHLGADKISGGTWRLLIFSIFVFGIMFVGYLGLKFGYGSFVAGQISAIDTEIEELAKVALPREQEAYAQFYFQLINLEELLNNHVFASHLFPLIEDRTNKDVAFTALTLNVSQNQANLSGLAKDFKIFAEQLYSFERSPKVTKVNTQGANADPQGFVTFRLDLGLAPDVLR